MRIDYRIVRDIAKLATCPMPVEVYGKENVPPTGLGIIASNHPNWRGHFVLPTRLDREVRFLVGDFLVDRKQLERKVLEDLSREGYLLAKPASMIASYITPTLVRIGRPIPANDITDPGNGSAIENCVDALKHGELIVIYPEGKKSKIVWGGTELREFKYGLASIIFRMYGKRVPVIPSATIGTRTLKFGEPLYIEDVVLGAENVPPDKIRERIYQPFMLELRTRIEALI